jgi:hypothetical protein
MLLRRHKQNKVEKPVRHEPVSLPKDDFPKHTGGGWYELSNGDKVQGKDEAKKAEKEAGD